MNIELSRLIRYLIVAVFAYFIDMGGFVVLVSCGLDPVFSNIVVKFFAALFGFFGHRYFTYRIKNHIGFYGHAVKYFGLVLIYTPLSSLSLVLMMKLINTPVIAKFICDVLLFIAVYWLTSKFTFLQSTEEAAVET